MEKYTSILLDDKLDGRSKLRAERLTGRPRLGWPAGAPWVATSRIARLSLAAAILLGGLSWRAEAVHAAIGISSASNEFRVNTTTSGDQYPYWWSLRVVAVQPDGAWINVWIDTGGADGQAKGIFMQRYDASGAALGGETLVNTLTSGDQDSASIAVAPDGSFVIAWYGPGTSEDCFAQRFTAAGVKLGDEFLLNQTVNGNQRYPEVVFRQDGTMIAGWVDSGKTVLQRFDAQMKPIGDETNITAPSGDVTLDSLDVRPDGSTIVAWTDSGDVFARVFGVDPGNGNLTPLTAAIQLNQTTTGVQRYAVTRADGQGRFMATWESEGQDGSGNGVYGRRFAADGLALGNEFALTTNTAGDQFGSQLAVHPSGNFVVVWADQNNRDGGGGTGESIWLRLFDPAGNPVGTELQVNQSTTGLQSYPVVALNDAGRLVVAWEGNGTQTGQVDTYGTFARRFQLSQIGTTAVTVSPSLVTAGDVVTVSMTLTAPTTITQVSPNPLALNGTSGVFATLLGGPSPASASVGPGGATFTWTYRVTALAQQGMLRFGGNADDNGQSIWPYGVSGFITVRPALFIRDLTAPNLIGDSNVASQPQQGPRVFTIGAEVCNANTLDMADVLVHVGDGATPGTFPATTMTLGQTNNTYQGTFRLDLLAAAADASRGLGTLRAAKAVINGGVDFDGNGGVGPEDDGTLANGIGVINGGLDVNADNVVNASDDRTEPPRVIDGSLDLDGDGQAPPDGDDDGTYGGECGNLYWQVAYEVLDAFGKPTWGNNQALPDDLRYFWSFWGTGLLGGVTRTARAVDSARVRNEISASANKIQPSGGSPPAYISTGFPRLIDGYVDVNNDGSINTADDGTYFSRDVFNGGIDINGDHQVDAQDDGVINTYRVIDGRVDANGDNATTTLDDLLLVQTGQTFSVTVHNATFGTVGAGFDEDRDNLFDYDFWHQPIGETGWNAGSFRLVDIDSDITGAGGSCPLNNITTHFDNEPYLSRIFNGDLFSCSFTADYTYTFLAIGPGTTGFSPYQEAASGTNNEKYNGDYCGDDVAQGTCFAIATGLPGLDIAKAAAPSTVATGGVVAWSLTYTNISGGSAGEPDSGQGIVIKDAIPAHTTFVAGSATCATYPCTVGYSTDNGATFSSVEPPAAGVTDLRWHIDQVVPSGGAGTVSFQTAVKAGTADEARIPNVATIGIGDGPPVDSADAWVQVRTIVVGDRIWLDVDGDGVQDVGEPGLPNVTVVLRTWGPDGTPGNGDDVTVATTVTDGDGTYLFGDVPAGAGYHVDVTSGVPAGLVVSPGHADPTATFALVAGQAYLDADVGYMADAAGSKAVIGDLVWIDVDADGVQDAGEAGLGGVNLVLRGVGADGRFGTADDTTASTTSASDGSYRFTSVAPGTYRVEIPSSPAGYASTSGPQAVGGTTSPAIAVAAGDAYLEADFGFDRATGLAVVGDALWLDTDGDGLKDAGEPGIGGVTVVLRDGTGKVIATTVSAAGGGFSFPGVPDGSYTIAVTDVADILGPYYGTTVAATTGTQAVTVAGADVTGTHFGYLQTGMIGDLVWVDTDGDGVQDGGEPGLGGVTVKLYTDRNGDSAVDATVAVVGNKLDLDNSGAVTTADDGRWYGVPVIDGLLDMNRDGVVGAADDGTLNGTTITDGAIQAANGPVDGAWELAVTDEAGAYRFTGLADRAYRVSVDGAQGALTGYTLSPGTPDEVGGQAGAQQAVTLSLTNRTDLSADFGYQRPANPQVSGSVFHDLDADGRDDGAGEPPFAGVTVMLRTAGGATVAVATTDANGAYSFTDVPPGGYVVAVTDAGGVLVDHTLTSGLDALPIIVGAVDITGLDFGYVRSPLTGSIGDRVWLDADRDGVQDGAEAGLPNVTLKLYRDNGDGAFDAVTDTLVGTAATGLTGGYVFAGLPAGSYFVDVDTTTLPAGLAPTTGTTNPGPIIPLAEGAGYPDADFGYGAAAGGALGDRVWYDADGDGLQDPGEPGIGGVAVTVTGPGCSPCTAVTDPDGLWLKTGLAAGSYVVAVNPATLPAGYATTPTNGPTSRAALVVAGADNLTLDFGFNGGVTGSIGDKVFLDLDRDGALDAGEPGIANVSLNLVGPGPDAVLGTADDLVLATTVTSASGDYDFAGLPAGSYRVAVTDVAQVLAGLNLSAGTNPTATIALAAGQDHDTADFPYAPTAGAIGNQVWHDLDGDGHRDAGEPGVEGVAVDLWLDVDGDGALDPGLDNLVRSTVTDINGTYEFLGLPAGRYLVDVTAANTGAGGVLAGMSRTSGTPNLDDDGQADPYAVELTAVALQSFKADFGYTAPGAGFSISGRVFDDVNGNGGTVPTDEAGTDTPVLGATVRLYRDLDNDGVVDPGDPLLGSAVTAADGDYAFTDLPNGAYLLVSDATATRVNAYTQTTQVPTRAVEPAAIAGADVVDQDFGYHLAAPPPGGAIGNSVWLDANGDGVQDAGEPGIANVTVQLWNADHTLLLASRPTDADGNYLFTGVGFGTYQVDVLDASLASGLVQTQVPAGGGDLVNHADPFTPVTLSLNGENLTADFGYNWAPSADTGGGTGTGAIGDRVWIDADGDGRQDPGEAGLSGLMVALDTPGPDGILGTGDDVLAATTVSDPDGGYVFDGLAYGVYAVRIPTPPAGHSQTGDPDHFGTTGVNDHQTTAPVVLGPGDVFVDADFGYQPTAGTFGGIGDRVWSDPDADGVQDAGEAGIPGVTVALILDSDGDGLWDAGEPVIATDITDGDGLYLFGGLPVTDGAGGDDYLVWVNDTDHVLSAYDATFDKDGLAAPAGGVVTGGNIAAVSNLSPAGVTDADFGFTAEGHAAGRGFIGDTIYLDRDADGVADAGEGIEGVGVELYDGTGTSLLASTTTDENGTYAFGNLDVSAAGEAYRVVVASTSFSSGAVLQGLTNTFDPDGGAANQSDLTLTTASPANLAQDFGYRPGANPGSIGNLVWTDTDADGLKDAGEAGLSGVTVDLYRDLDGDGRLDPGEPRVGSTTTAGDGAYLFGNLPTADNALGASGADYIVHVGDRDGVLAGFWHSLGTAGADNHSQADPYAASVSVARPNDPTADFGFYVQPGALGNFVWNDLDADGIQDAGEPGIPRVVVSLTITWRGGGTTTVKTTTDATGAYSFGNLLLDEDHDGVGAGEPTFSLTFAAPGGFDEGPTGSGTTFTDNDWDGSTPVSAQPREGMTDMAPANLTDAAASYDAGFVSLSDFGDLLDSYATTLSDDGPRHVLGARYLGDQAGDIDADGQPGATAIGDGEDEDGVVRDAATQWRPGQTVDIDVQVGGAAGTLGLWLDLDASGAFEADEFFAFPNLAVGSHTLQVTLTADYVTGGVVYARARLFDPAALPGGTLDASDSLGAAVDGEVEDYQWQFAPTAVTLIDLSARAGGTNATLLLAMAALAILGTVAGRRVGRRRGGNQA